MPASLGARLVIAHPQEPDPEQRAAVTSGKFRVGAACRAVLSPMASGMGWTRDIALVEIGQVRGTTQDQITPPARALPHEKRAKEQTRLDITAGVWHFTT